MRSLLLLLSISSFPLAPLKSSNQNSLSYQTNVKIGPPLLLQTKLYNGFL